MPLPKPTHILAMLQLREFGFCTQTGYGIAMEEQGLFFEGREASGHGQRARHTVDRDKDETIDVR